MKNLTRRDLLKASAAIVASRNLIASGAMQLQQILEGQPKVPVVWLQGQGCTGCSVSLLNSIYYTTIDDLLINTLDLKFHSTMMASAGDLAVSAADNALLDGGYVLVVEGAVPSGANGKYCHIWPGTSMYDGVVAFSQNATFILAVGTCAAFGGMAGGNPNPTQAQGVQDILGSDPRLINIPGCPAHPDWIVGTIAYLLTYGQTPSLDVERRPLEYFGKRIHNYCPQRRRYCGQRQEANILGEDGCLKKVGCRGQWTYADCFMRKWNSGEAETFGVNWCIEARTPCHGCVESSFPDGMSPFFERAN
ncbi:MAG: hydrogenase small subunit [Planctomycetota bacterium]|jgi:NiFe hydrogenase small subunit HydA